MLEYKPGYLVRFERSDLEQMNCDGRKGQIKKSSMIDGVGRKVLRLAMELFHQRSNPEGAVLVRPVRLRQVPKSGSWGNLEIHFRVSSEAKVVQVYIFHVVSADQGANAKLYLQKHYTYRET